MVRPGRPEAGKGIGYYGWALRALLGVGGHVITSVAAGLRSWAGASAGSIDGSWIRGGTPDGRAQGVRAAPGSRDHSDSSSHVDVLLSPVFALSLRLAPCHHRATHTPLCVRSYVFPHLSPDRAPCHTSRLALPASARSPAVAHIYNRVVTTSTRLLTVSRTNPAKLSTLLPPLTTTLPQPYPQRTSLSKMTRTEVSAASRLGDWS